MTEVLPAPIVYVGPTMQADQVRAHLPQAIVRPPIRRGDLYRDRILRGGIFVILDGLFMQHLAIAPREVLDVLDDGACVVGASSMGALRAAECWPAGMRGAGAIYRMFRLGWLTSDDEVVVAFDPDTPARTSVALINVRYVARAAVSRGLLGQEHARTMVEAAASLFYADRTWSRILSLSGLTTRGDLHQMAAHLDLKRVDAVRALRLARRLAEDRPVDEFRRVGVSFAPRDLVREQQDDPLLGRRQSSARDSLTRWLVMTGQARLHARTARAWSRWILQGPPASIAAQLWAALAESGELNGALYRYHAFQVARRRARGVRPPVDQVEVARQTLADAHGFASWTRLEAGLTTDAADKLGRFATRLAAARMVARSARVACQIEPRRG